MSSSERVDKGAVSDPERTLAELARNEAKFRILFEQMPLPLVQTNAGGLLSKFQELRAEGVADLGAYFDAHPDFIDELLEIIMVDEVNQPMVEVLGATDKSEVAGSIARYWKTHPDTVLRSLVARYRGDNSYFEETQVDRLDGRLIDVDYWVAYPPEMNQLGIGLTALIDVTERKRATEEIRRRERRFRDLFNKTPIALWQLDTHEAREKIDALRARGVTDLNVYAAEHPEFLPEVISRLRIVEINEAALKLFGAPDAEALRPNMLALWLDPKDLIGATVAREAGERTYSVETRIRTMDGRVVDIWVNTAFGDPDDPDDPNLVGAIDISERKRASEEIRLSEIKFRNLFNQTPIALWQLDSREAGPMLNELYAAGVTDYAAYVAANPDFLQALTSKLRITEVNDAALALVGATERDRFSPELFDRLFDSMNVLPASAARRRGEPSYSVERKMQTLDGRTLDVLSSVAFPGPGDPSGLNLVAAIDISTRVQAEEMLRKVQAEFAHAARIATLGELTASIAHEVNQPLAAIVTNGEASLRWLAREEPDVEEVRTLATRMVADARRAADVIARIRTMATGKAPEHLPMSVNEAAEAASSFLRHEFELHRVAVKLELAPDLPAVRADRTQLQQVFVNLAVNATQAMVQHGTGKPAITVRTSRSAEGGVLVEVEDSGPGVPADHLAHLFDSFFTTKDSGLGIGLSICRSIVEAHGGRISCVNLPVGARFSFTLPAA